MLLSSSVLLVVALAPLVGALLAGLFGTAFLGNVLSRTMAHRITILGVAISFALSVWVLQQVLAGASFHATIYQWMVIGN